jgi:hypothetical protein
LKQKKQIQLEISPKPRKISAFEGFKVHEPMYGIVVHGVPIAGLDTTAMTDAKVIKRLETENNRYNHKDHTSTTQKTQHQR